VEITTSAYARIGFMGNPSDGYFGRTISCAITNFAATVTLKPQSNVAVEPHPIHDPSEFESLYSLANTVSRNGYAGGVRLLISACKKFHEYCGVNKIALHDRGFALSYDTTIPRQVGLAGSSAIITATIETLKQHYDVEVPRPKQPNLVLSVEEEELDIRAGLQDRVIQTYGGVVYMDFAKELFDERGYGEYEPMDPLLMPGLFLAYLSHPSDSGKIHSDVRARWHEGDVEVINAMTGFADFASEARKSLEAGDIDGVGGLMNANFDLRRRIFGDAVIGPSNLEMVEIARSLDAPAKFSGSGGAVVGMYRSDEQLSRLRGAYADRGYNLTILCIDGAGGD